MRITYSECVFAALGIQHAMHMRHTVICGLSGSIYFSTLSHNAKIFSEKKKIQLLSIKCVLIFWYNFYLKHLSC